MLRCSRQSSQCSPKSQITVVPAKPPPHTRQPGQQMHLVTASMAHTKLTASAVVMVHGVALTVTLVLLYAKTEEFRVHPPARAHVPRDTLAVTAPTTCLSSGRHVSSSIPLSHPTTSLSISPNHVTLSVSIVTLCHPLCPHFWISDMLDLRILLACTLSGCRWPC